MKFNPETNKEPQEVHFSNRTNKDSFLFITFNNHKVEIISSKNYLALILEEWLNFKEHLVKINKNKCFKITGFLRRLCNKLPRDAFLQIYKSSIRYHLN